MWICLLVTEVENTAWETRKGSGIVVVGVLSLRMLTRWETSAGGRSPREQN